jgi:hypothetical protein
LVEVEQDTGASISPKVASAMAVGGSRCGKAAAVMKVAREATGVRERRWPGLGWVGLTDPDPSQLVKPARWAGRPVGPEG